MPGYGLRPGIVWRAVFGRTQKLPRSFHRKSRLAIRRAERPRQLLEISHRRASLAARRPIGRPRVELRVRAANQARAPYPCSSFPCRPQWARCCVRVPAASARRRSRRPRGSAGMSSGRSSIRCPSLRSPTLPARHLSTSAMGGHLRCASPTQRQRSRRAACVHPAPARIAPCTSLIGRITHSECRSWRRRASSTRISIWPSARPASAPRWIAYARAQRFSYRARTYRLRRTHVLTYLLADLLTCAPVAQARTI